jgi:outer membrane receptor protein involved in Fe transport
MLRNNGLKLMIMLIMALSCTLNAQRFQYGKLKGTVTEKGTNEPLQEVSVYLTSAKLGKKIGSTTDPEGNYKIHSIPFGDYVLVAEYVGYHKVVIENIRIFFTDFRELDISMKIDEIQLSEIEVTAQAERTSKEVIIQRRLDELKVLDAISAEEMTSYGSSDAAAAMKHVTGASVDDGKYVFVRGLGNRYSAVHINGIEMPSADPDRNSFQLDLVSSSVMDDITTSKSFTPDKPGNFAGGLIDISTKSLQEENMAKVSVSNGYNPNVSLGDYLTYEGGKKDWMGFDDGTRDIPNEIRNVNLKDYAPLTVVGATNDSIRLANTDKVLKLHQYSKAFNNIMVPEKGTAPLNQSYGLSLGKKLKFKSESFLDIISTLKYSSKFESYENGMINNYVLTGSGAEELHNEFSFKENKSEYNVDINGLINLQYRLTPHHDFFYSTVFTQSGSDVARYISGHFYDGNMEPEETYETRVLKWTERHLVTNQLRGKHRFTKFFDTSVEWNGTYSVTGQNEPDTRYFSDHYSTEYDITWYEDEETGDMIADTLGTYRNYKIMPSLYKEPSRYFRQMDEDSYNFDVKITYPFSLYRNADSKFKTGAYVSSKDRKYRERAFQLSNQEQLALTGFNGDPYLFFSEGCGIIDVAPLGTSNTRYTWGNYLVDASEKRSNYDGYQDIFAVFAMTDLPVTDRMTLTAGARLETTKMEAATQDSTYKQGKIKESDILPAGIFNYRIKDNIIAKLSYGKTIARPSIRELAPFPSLDFSGGFFFTGNPDLERTLIDNFDLRLDYFERPGELYSVSLYYKYFKNPIEKAFLNDNKEIQFQNVDRAEVKGVELEIKKDLDQIHPLMKYFFVSTNFSYIISEVKIPEREMAGILAADSLAKDTRPLQGQPELLFNLYFQFNNKDTNTNAGISYNLTGEKLSENSKGGTPNIYEKAMHKMGASFSQKFLTNYEIKLGVDNIFDQAVEKVYYYRGKEFIFSKYKKGSEYSLSITYSL